MRYSTQEINQLWSDENKYNVWLAIELEAAKALSSAKIIPEADLEAILKVSSVDINRIKELEKTFHHEVIAFLQAMMEQVAPTSSGRFIHYGMTSSDIIDTAQAMIMYDSLSEILKDTKKLIKALREKQQLYRLDPCIGRTHGQHAEPTTVGMRFFVWMHEICWLMENVDYQTEFVVSNAKVSGAVGTHAHLPKTVEVDVMQSLGLDYDPAATQIIPRCRYASIVFSLANLMSGLEKIAQNIRLLQIPEIGEMHEPFAATQRGSSAMPHKRNPISCERICSLARVARGFIAPTMESNATWLERDLSNSAMERIILPSIFGITHYCVRLMTDIISGLDVNAAASRSNVMNCKDQWASQSLMLSMVRNGMDKSKAYEIIKHCTIDDVVISDEVFGMINIKDAESLDKHIRGADETMKSWGS